MIGRKSTLIALAMLILILLTACKPSTPATSPTQPAQPSLTLPPPTQVPPTQPPPPTETLVPTPEPPTPTPPPTEKPGLPPLPAEPQTIAFQAEDGYAHQGTYYPAAVNPAPVIVLMHWAGGDQSDWPEIAFWLQNRGMGGNTPNPMGFPWLDSSWFPPMPDGQSFAVFTFSFRYCVPVDGCQQFDPDGWQLDAKAAIRTAAQLEGVDPSRLVAIGASIGADGAADGCYQANDESENICQGALSLSPGGYLKVPYAQAVAALGEEQPPKPDWCLFAAGDEPAAKACNSGSGDHYRIVQYSGELHGMLLIQPDLEPDTLLLILDFLELTLSGQ